MEVLNKLKEKNNFKFLVLIVVVLFLFLFISRGFSLWFVIAFILWALFIKKFKLFLLDEYSFDMTLQFFVGLVVISLILLSFGGKKSSNKMSKDFSADAGREFSIKSEDGSLVGNARVTPTEGGFLSIEYAFKLVDSEIKNNGKCIDKEGSWCSDDPDGLHNKIQQIRYHYTAHFPFKSEGGYLMAPTIQPMYCNQQLFEQDPFANSASGYWCNFNTAANWKPTDTFLIKGSSGFGSVDELLSIEKLDLYDFSDYYQITYETTDKSGKMSEGPILSNKEITERAPLVKTYKVTVSENVLE